MTHKVFELAHLIQHLNTERDQIACALTFADGNEENAAQMLHYARLVSRCVFN